jgi:agmatine deiminase
MSNAALDTNKTPAELGFSMPAEWDRHEATWLGWPHNPTDWPDKLDTIRWVYGEMVRKISAGELVRVLVDNAATERIARRYLTRAGCDLRKVRFVKHATNRGWMRDSGPIFVRKKVGRNRKTENAIVHFHFNAWAKYDDWQKDRRVPEMAASLLRKPLFNARFRGKEFVLEGGGIEVNGRGTVLTTEECYLDPRVQVRNPGLGRKEYEQALKAYLGVTNVLWLVAGPVGDDTHGHIDDICRFVDRRTLVLIKETRREDPAHVT